MLELGLCVLLCLAVHVHGFGSGAPVRVCNNYTLAPLHPGNQPQTSSPQYRLIVTPGTNYTYQVEIKADGNGDFQGFMIKARYPGSTDNTYLGKFDSPPDGTKYGECGTRTQTVTHTSTASKKTITVNWIPESDNCNKEIEFQGTVLQNYNTFWILVMSNKQLVMCPTTATTPAVGQGVSSTQQPVSSTSTKEGLSTTPSTANNMFTYRWTFYLHLVTVTTLLVLV